MAAEPLIAAEYQIGDQVEKYTGDYRARGEIRGIFTMKNGAVRYVVEHKADGGSFCHISSEKNLRRVSSTPLSIAQPGFFVFRQARVRAVSVGVRAQLVEDHRNSFDEELLFPFPQET